MKFISFLKSNTGFYVVIFLVFISIMFALNIGYPYYPNPPPNELQQQGTAPSPR